MKAVAAGVLALLTLIVAGVVSGQATYSVEGLRCEYLSNPLGIDVEKPRLSWLLTPGPRGRQQDAYQVLVASSQASLQQNKGDVWDSGKTAPGRPRSLLYAGRALTTGMRVWWKVRAWDHEGRVTMWSQPAWWSMGVLHDSEWEGRWIGLARPAGVKEGVPLPSPWLRKTFTLEQKPARGTAYVNTLGYYELYVNGRKVDDYVLTPAVVDYSRRNWYLTHDITDYLVQGQNSVALWLGRGLVRAGPSGSGLRRADGAGAVGDRTAWREGGQGDDRRNVEGQGESDHSARQGHGIRRLWRGALRRAPGSGRLGWRQAGRFGLGSGRCIRSAKGEDLAQMVEPNRAMETLKPVKIEPTPAGGWLIDMGKNSRGGWNCGCHRTSRRERT